MNSLRHNHHHYQEKRQLYICQSIVQEQMTTSKKRDNAKQAFNDDKIILLRCVHAQKEILGCFISGEKKIF
jgi:hypothetical protein